MNQETEFFQSESWLAFQEATGKEIVRSSDELFLASGIIHSLPFVGEYLYVPRGPRVTNIEREGTVKKGVENLLALAEEKKMKWIRIEPMDEEVLEHIRATCQKKIVRAPHDMQPRETFVVDIMATEAELLAQMKPKTRYNIRLAEKRGVKVFATDERKYQEAFLDLIVATADRKTITPHPRSYYEKYFSAFPPHMCQLFVAEYRGKVLAANLIIFYGDMALYVHGGSSDAHRDVMAPYLLHWEQIKYAKTRGCAIYDFGGVRTESAKDSWQGITTFKLGFSPQTTPTLFPGTYDIVIDEKVYFLYNFLQSAKKLLSFIKKRLF